MINRYFNNLMFILLALLPFQLLAANNVKYNENDVKVAFLYRSLQYIKWENILNNKEDPIIICSQASPEISNLLKTLHNRSVAERKILLQPNITANNSDNCNVIYIQASSVNQFKSSIKAFKNKPVLTVNDRVDFRLHGAILNFITRNHRITIEVNMEMAKKANIIFSAKYLRIANIITNGN